MAEARALNHNYRNRASAISLIREVRCCCRLNDLGIDGRRQGRSLEPTKFNPSSQSKGKEGGTNTPLDQFGRDLTEMARDGKVIL